MEYILTHNLNGVENDFHCSSMQEVKAHVNQVIIANKKNIEIGVMHDLRLNDWHDENGVLTCEFFIYEKNGKEKHHTFQVKEKTYF